MKRKTLLSLALAASLLLGVTACGAKGTDSAEEASVKDKDVTATSSAYEYDGEPTTIVVILPMTCFLIAITPE